MPVPKVVIVELTNYCNLHCPFCTTNLAMSREKGFMDLDLFRKVVAELKAENHYPLISMNMCGEPLLHKNADKFVGEAYKNGFSTYISTNATTLDSEMSEKLIVTGLDSIALCLDGFSVESHEAYRIGSSFKQVKANCETFLSIRKRLHARNPKVIIQTLLTSYSETEVNDILSWAWKNGADEVYFKTINTGSLTSPEQRREGERLLPQNPLYKRRQVASTAKCPMPEEHIIIYWNGKIGVCCIDFNNSSNLPGIADRDLFSVLYDAEVESARHSAFNKEHDLCKICQSSNKIYRGFRIPLDHSGHVNHKHVREPDWSALIEREILNQQPYEVR